MRHLIALPVLFAAACSSAAREPATPPPSAEPLDPAAFALAREGHRAEVLDGTVYAFGGFSGEPDPEERGSRDVRRFDPVTGGWEATAPLAVQQAFAGSAVLDGALYALGGGVQRYDPERDEWQVVLEGPVLPDTHFACASFGTRAYVLGGYPAERSGFYAYHARTNAVESLPPPPGFEPSDHFAFLFVLDGELHLAGGLDTTGFEPVAQHYVFADDEWSERAPPPMPIWAKFSASGVIGGSFYVFLDGKGLRYDAATDSWSEVAARPEPLVMPACLELDGRLLSVGGVSLSGSRSTARAGVFDPLDDAWRVVP